VTGSLAYDHVMAYDGLFKDSLLPEQLEHLSIAFTASQKSVHFGGCAGNIAYTLRLFEEDPVVFGVAGKDFDEYEKWMKMHRIDTTSIFHYQDDFTASAYIMTDREQNQITMFHAGAMNAVPNALSLRDYKNNNFSLAIISPDDPNRMIRLAQECKEMKIPYIFDPSQQLTSMSPDDLMASLQGATGFIANEYEIELLLKMLHIKKEKLCDIVPTVIETYGPRGSGITSREGIFFVRAVQPSHVVDPTGCGDAFRAGVLFGLKNKLPMEKVCQIGNLAATYVIENKGTQSHTFTMEVFKKRLEENFGEAF